MRSRCSSSDRAGWLALAGCARAHSRRRRRRLPTAHRQPAAGSRAGGPPSAAADAPRSLFEPTWRQFEFGGRFSSIDGDPARFQRYEDFRDGVLFTDARYAREEPDGRLAVPRGGRQRRLARSALLRRLRAHRAASSSPACGIRSRSSTASTPQTPYTSSDGALVARRRDAARDPERAGDPVRLRAAGPAVRSAGAARHRRRELLATPTPQLDLTAAFTHTRHVGELPWGASFGFSNDVEVALPYDSRTNDFTLGAEWTNNRSMLRVAYNGSWFDNLDDTLVWDSPLRLDDSTSAPGRGRMALWPSNSAQTVSVGGYTKLAQRTQLTGFVSFGSGATTSRCSRSRSSRRCRSSTLPRATAEAEANVFSTNLNLVSRPATDWRFSARFRRYDYDNQTPATSHPASSSTTTRRSRRRSTGGPELYAHSRTTFDADATWSGLAARADGRLHAQQQRLRLPHLREHRRETCCGSTADAVGSQWVTFRAQYELSDRSGSGLDEDAARADRRAAGDAALRRRQPDAQSFHRAGGHRAQRPVDVQRLRRRRQGRLRRQLLRPAGIDVPDVLAWRRLPRSRTASAAARSYNYERYAGCSNRDRRAPGQENRSDARLDGGLDRDA